VCTTSAQDSEATPEGDRMAPFIGGGILILVNGYKKIRIFLASPVDVKKDREQIRKTIAQINQEISDDRGLILQAMDWRDVAPGMGRPEAVILDQLPVDEWDLFIGLIWHRFGTATGGADPVSGRLFASGTEEEFKLAYDAWKETGRPRIMFYRCVRGLSPDKLDPEQIQRVHDFFAGFAADGQNPGLLRYYKSAKELEGLVRLHIFQHLQKGMSPAATAPARLMLKGKELLLIPAGPFLMGEDVSPSDPNVPSSQPAHTVTLEAYYLSRFPITNAEYQRFVDATGHPVPYRDDEFSRPYNWHRDRRTYPEGQADHPVVLVSWHDAQAYCRWAGVRLPNEAEWEKAARGVASRIWPWGDLWQERLCNAEGSGWPGTSAVGLFSPQGDSPFGLGDMAGNIWEWCSSSPFPYPYRAADGRESPQRQGPRILRGGSFGSSREWVRCALRNSADAQDYGFNTGFRVALSLPAAGSG
jgi:formylglycine-generating enzyme required for sulfatase activity